MVDSSSNFLILVVSDKWKTTTISYTECHWFIKLMLSSEVFCCLCLPVVDNLNNIWLNTVKKEVEYMVE